MILQIKKMKRVKAKMRIKWWKLKEEELCSVFWGGIKAGSLWLLPDDWESTAGVVKETATKMFVLSAGQRKKGI